MRSCRSDVGPGPMAHRVATSRLPSADRSEAMTSDRPFAAQLAEPALLGRASLWSERLRTTTADEPPPSSSAPSAPDAARPR